MRLATAVLLLAALTWAVPPVPAADSAPAPAPAPAAPPPVADTPFPQEHSDPGIVPDPGVRFGHLDNGLRYCLMANDQPKNKVVLRLQVQNGSLEEDDEQLGLAHFMEHMCFDGSSHYPPGKLVEYLQSIGLAFGADTNAYTSFEETVYKLDMPDTKPETIATALQVLGDYASTVLLLPEQLNKERGVILAEMRDRNTPQYRDFVTGARHIFKGTRLPLRMPIGIKLTVDAATPERMRSFYDDWYRPEMMVLTVVGAIDPAAVEAQVKTALAGITDRSHRERPPLGAIEPGSEVLVVHEPEDNGTQASIELVRNRQRPHDTLAERRASLLRELGTRVFNRRIADMVEHEPQGAILGGEMSLEQWLELWDASVSVQCRPGQAVAALQRMLIERRRMLAFGPTSDELAVVVAALRAELDQAVAQAGTRTNGGLAAELYETTFHDQVFLSPQQEHDLYQPLLAAATVEDVAAALKDAWSTEGARTVSSIIGRDDLGAVGQTAAEAAVASAEVATIAPPAARAVPPWAYGEVAGDGVVLSQQEPSGIPEKVFANHVLANFKKTGFQPNQVLVEVRLAIPPVARQPGLSDLVGMCFLAGGLGKHSAEDLRQIFAGSSVKLGGPSFDDDGAFFTATCLPKDLDSCLQQLRAYIEDPGWRDDAAVRAKTSWIEGLIAQASDLDAQVERNFFFAAVDNMPQRRPVTVDEAKAATLADARAWFQPYLQTAPLEISVVGDFDAEAAGKAVQHYFGTLGERRPHALVSDPKAPGALAPAPPLPAKVITLDVPGTNPRALIMVGWPTTDFADEHQLRRLQLLAGAMTEKLRQKIRNELGQAYSPYAFSSVSEVYSGFGFIGAVVGVAPDRAEEARAAVLAIAADLAAHGVDDQLMTRVKEPVIKSLAARRQRNEYWLYSVLARAQEQPFRIGWSDEMVADYNAITAQELSALAAKFLDNTKSLQVIGICHGSPVTTAPAGQDKPVSAAPPSGTAGPGPAAPAPVSASPAPAAAPAPAPAAPGTQPAAPAQGAPAPPAHN